jgi:hypothetical protein
LLFWRDSWVSPLLGNTNHQNILIKLHSVDHICSIPYVLSGNARTASMVGIGDWRSCPLLVKANNKWDSFSKEEQVGAAVAGGATLALAGVFVYRRCVDAHAHLNMCPVYTCYTLVVSCLLIIDHAQGVEQRVRALAH